MHSLEMKQSRPITFLFLFKSTNHFQMLKGKGFLYQ
uniref:Uncharacterized protein n=1 Tax=Rhizophora mucronata TaxID=61149 RepID=A0A2P2M635_RHIMU